MIEEQIYLLFMSNGVGVAFGILMYRMATTTLQDLHKSIEKLIVEIKVRK